MTWDVRKAFPPGGWRKWAQQCGVSVLAGVIGVGLSGCDGKRLGAVPPPAAVTVALPIQKEVVEWDTYTGYLEAPESVSVAARVSGLITECAICRGVHR